MFKKLFNLFRHKPDTTSCSSPTISGDYHCCGCRSKTHINEMMSVGAINTTRNYPYETPPDVYVPPHED